MPTIESSKLTERVAINFTETELLDLVHLASSEDRTVAEYIRRVVRRDMYGVSKRPRREGNEYVSALGDLGGTERS